MITWIEADVPTNLMGEQRVGLLTSVSTGPLVKNYYGNADETRWVFRPDALTRLELHNISEGKSCDEKRVTVPSFEMRNFSKFQRISPVCSSEPVD